MVVAAKLHPQVVVIIGLSDQVCIAEAQSTCWDHSSNLSYLQSYEKKFSQADPELPGTDQSGYLVTLQISHQ